MSGNQVATAPKSVAGLCDSPAVQRRLNEVLGKKAAQFVSSLISVTNNNKLLAKADPSTVVASAMIAATLDLPINQSLGFAYIVPYKGQAQFQLGYKGLIQLAMRSGQFKTLNDFVVPHGSLQSYDPITGEVKIDWEAGDDSKDPDGYGVYMALTNGFSKMVFWSMEKVKKHAMRFSQAYSKGYECPWKSDFDQMALKTVIKATLSKYAPLSVDMQRGIEADQGVVDMNGNVTGYPDNEPEAAPDPFQAAKPAEVITEENIDIQNETAPASKAKITNGNKQAEVSEKSAKEPTGESYPEVNPDALANLIMDTEGLDDGSTTKAAIALSILPKDYKGSVMEAPQEAINEMVGRWSEIVTINAK